MMLYFTDPWRETGPTGRSECRLGPGGPGPERPEQASVVVSACVLNYIFAVWLFILLALLTQVIWYTHVFLSASICLAVSVSVFLGSWKAPGVLCVPCPDALPNPVLLGLVALFCVAHCVWPWFRGKQLVDPPVPACLALRLGSSLGVELLGPSSHFDTNRAGRLWTSIYCWLDFSAPSVMLCCAGHESNLTLHLKAGVSFVQASILTACVR